VDFFDRIMQTRDLRRLARAAKLAAKGSSGLRQQ
jgi:hypothetical protein